MALYQEPTTVRWNLRRAITKRSPVWSEKFLHSLGGEPMNPRSSTDFTINDDTKGDPMSTRSISRLDTPAPPAPGGIGWGHTAVKVVQPTALDSSDPFVLLVDDRFDFEARRRIGGAHPHGGLETVTLILDGTLHDRDVGDLAAGDAIWMSAGRGIIHDENVEVGPRVRLLQLWIALPTRDRALQPQFEIIRREAAPVVRLADAEAVLYSGTSGSVSSPTHNRVPATMIDLSMEPNATFEQDLPPSYNGFFYVLDGGVQVGGDPVAAGHVGWLAPSSSPELVISAQDSGARLVLYAGQPLGEPLTQQGPFVAGSPSEIIDFNRRFHSDEFTSMSDLVKGLSGEVRAPGP
jgi:redox-sensitive bicupin YhaK (pirin superfamily)